LTMEMPTSWVHGAGGSFFWPHVPGAGVGGGVTGAGVGGEVGPGVGVGVTVGGVGGEVGPGVGEGVGTGAVVEDGAGVDACAGLQ